MDSNPIGFAPVGAARRELADDRGSERYGKNDGSNRSRPSTNSPRRAFIFPGAATALEEIVPGGLRGCSAGVFSGVIRNDYANVIHRTGAEAISRHMVTGYHCIGQLLAGQM
jgi:hypothetical protein